MQKLRIKTSKPYQVFIGAGTVRKLKIAAWHIIIISDQNVAKCYAPFLRKLLEQSVKKVDLLTFPAGEQNKNISTYYFLQNSLLELGADRETVLLALGGGVVGDLTGFVAATYMRGVRYVQIPTTLLAAVDSSVGGKTGIDLPEAKNIIGAFWQPEAVYIDLDFFRTLPKKQFSAGLAEVIKTAMVGDAGLFKILEKVSLEDLKSNDKLLEQVVARSVVVKQRIVEQDEREANLRQLINFGHTIGHAIESLTGYKKLNHGEAIAIGMLAELTLSPVHKKLCSRLEILLKKFSLPVKIPRKLATKDIFEAIKHDKKRREDELALLVIERLGKGKVKSFEFSKHLVEELTINC